MYRTYRSCLKKEIAYFSEYRIPVEEIGFSNAFRVFKIVYLDLTFHLNKL